ncbi:putative uncharacterized protein DDB_G0282499 [Ctenocephalides felis]|uniref:putative uncharacterized protein DDB_G0282499 n=1 Tax=Ctenocephalides felis TaxID=7515 RepID=UPI000E6E25C1|nr:putative uncharacterized protein DDB_G0282499 [Ctenocephalides felis]
MATETQAAIPSHHARRPMNAFLIFCKRHRNVVKERYPNLENRCITKILGEWWAGLESNEKFAYTNLAKQYKDAFFNANPDFKWYKLPAPSLRLISIQPENVKNEELFVNKASDTINNASNTITSETPSLGRQDQNKWDQNFSHGIKLEDPHRINNIFSPGKLADENQLGNLRKLFDTSCNNNNENDNQYVLERTGGDYAEFQNNNNSFTEKSDLHKNNVKELEHALQEANTFIMNVFEEQKVLDNNHSYIYNGPKISFNEISVKASEPSHKTKLKKDLNIGRDYKPKQKFDSFPNSQRNLSYETCDLYFPKKSSRSCKGKRYEEFKNKGLINTKSKPTTMNKTSISLSNTFEEADKLYYDAKSFVDSNEVVDADNDRNESKSNDQNDILKYCDDDKMCAYIEEDNALLSKGKFFHPSDFDLDGKINALPLLNLDEFLIKKKENKNTRKQIKKHIVKQKLDEGDNKIINSNVIPRDTFNDTSQINKTEIAVGSRKRKAVKQRITHLEFSDPSSYDMKYKNMAFQERTYLSDLSTLAEVAAKSSKISTNN